MKWGTSAESPASGGDWVVGFHMAQGATRRGTHAGGSGVVPRSRPYEVDSVVGGWISRADWSE
jgi:hypothetical protein